jgi:hypothetical protein
VFVSCARRAIPLFDRSRDHSSVPTNILKAGARSGGPGRPNGRREAALPWTGASTMARPARSGAHVWAVASLLFILAVCGNVALAKEEVAAQPPGDHALDLYAAFIREASQRFAVPARWIKSIIQLESAGDVRAKSPKGAMGLTQVMPETWAELRLRYDLGNDPYNARDNILAGTAYLAELRDRYGVPGAFAAYNAGPARYERHLAGEPLPAETQAYVSEIASLLGAELDSGRPHRELFLAAAPFFVARSERNSVPDWQQARSVANGALAPSGIHAPSSLIPGGTGLFIARSDAGGAR